jgi:hypothetical protein
VTRARLAQPLAPGAYGARLNLVFDPQTQGEAMTSDEAYLAVFLGDKNSPRAKAWFSLPEGERQAKEQQGIAAWMAWVEKHQSSIVSIGGPLGKTKKVSEHGIEDISNMMGAFTIVRAASHEAAAKLFEGHPHFTIFPGERIEVMPIKPIPGG